MHNADFVRSWAARDVSQATRGTKILHQCHVGEVVPSSRWLLNNRENGLMLDFTVQP